MASTSTSPGRRANSERTRESGPGSASSSPGPVGARLPAYRPPRGVRARERLRALGALVTLLVVIGGVPGALLLAIGSPIPKSAPSENDLTGAISPTTLLAILSIVVWLAWVHFVVCVLVEWRAERRGFGLPGHVPFGGGSQVLARRLVAATLLLSGTAVLAAPIHGSGHTARIAGPGRAAPAVSAPARPGSPMAGAAGGTGTVRPAGSFDQHSVPATYQARQATKYYEVRPHQGRNYDSLWGIAERYLGDGLRYREVFALNQGRLQPDGRSLEKPDLIHPGWTLYLPADAQGPGVMTVQPPATSAPFAPSSGTATGGMQTAPTPTSASGMPGTPTISSGTTGRNAAAPAQSTSGDAREQGDSGSTRATSNEPGGSGASAPVGPQHPVADGRATDQVPASHRGGLPHRGLAGASLLAAGILVALQRRRSRDGGAQTGGEAEVALRLAADEGAASFLDAALRHLSAELTATGRTLPQVFAASLSPDRLALFIAPAEGSAPPAPWTGGDEGRYWSLERDPETADGLPPGVTVPAGTPAPYPGLTTIGTDTQGARILVDLEGAPGIVSVGGDPNAARDVAVSVAVELATNRWSDELRVCLVGFSDDLTALAPHRLRYATNLAEVLDELEERSSRRQTSSGLRSVLLGRQAARTQSLVSPDLLVLSAPPTEEEVGRLAMLADGREHAVGVLTVGDTPPARWRFAVQRDGRMSTGVLCLEVMAQTLPVEDYQAILRMFEAADEVHRADGGIVVPLPRPGQAWFGSDPPTGPIPVAGSGPGQSPGRRRDQNHGAARDAVPPTPGMAPFTRAQPVSSTGPIPVNTTVMPTEPVGARSPREAPGAEDESDGPGWAPSGARGSDSRLGADEPSKGGAGPVDPAPREGAPAPTAAEPRGSSWNSPPASPKSAGPVLGRSESYDAHRPAAPVPGVLPDLTVPAAVEIRVLGALSVDAPGHVAPERAELLTELAIYLALHREGVHPGVLVSAIWPRGVSDDVVAATIGHLRAWLGSATAGRSRLITGEDGRWRLSDDVRCDWDLFQAFAARAGAAGSDAVADLTTALRLVSGPLWAAIPARRYAWLARTPIEGKTRSAVIGVAHRLASMALASGDTSIAVAACRTGLRATPASEQLWRDLLRTVASRGDRASMSAVAAEMYRTIAPAGSGLTPAAETDALVQELIPGYRRRTA
ncbi:MAG: BTAD domain-containing putative transcriptional regulator [Frankia sp.]